MNKADRNYKKNIKKILKHGCYDVAPRPKYADGTPAHTKFITGVSETYDISKGEFPVTSLRNTAIKSGIKEVLWIYQDQSNDLDLLKEKYGVTWWDEWDIGDRTIGQRYGATIKRYDKMNKLLEGIKKNPYGRSHIIDMWQEADLAEKGGLHPCAFMTMWSVRGEYLDMTMVQRSNDYIMAGYINKMQYVALQMMVAKATGYKPGNFVHFVQNLHIYDRHIEQAKEILKTKPSKKKPVLELDTDSTNFYDYKISDFKVKDYEPKNKEMKLEIAI